MARRGKRYEGDQPDVRVENCYVKHMTEKAMLVKVPKMEAFWIPRSQIRPDSEVFDDMENSEGTLVVSHWIAEQKGLVDSSGSKPEREFTSPSFGDDDIPF